MSCKCNNSDDSKSLNACGEVKSSCESFQAACHEIFRPTSPLAAGHILLKGSPGDKCLGHFKPTAKELFVINKACGSGQQLTNDVRVELPLAKIAEKTSAGNLVTDDQGEIIYKPAKFKKLKVASVEGAPENQWMDLEPQGNQVLLAKDGYWQAFPNLASGVVTVETQAELDKRVTYAASLLSLDEAAVRIILGIDPTP